MVEPDIDIFCHEHQSRHPFPVRTELLRFKFKALESVNLGGPWSEEGKLLFLSDQIEAAEKTIEVAAEKKTPMLADVFKLSRKGMGNSHGRAPEHLHKTLTEWSERGFFVEERSQGPDYREIGCVPLKARVIKKLGKRGKGRVHIGEPEKKHLLQRYMNIQGVIGLAFEIPFGRYLLPIYSDRRELLCKGLKDSQYLFATQGFIEEVECPFDGVGIDLPPIQPNDIVEDLVDQPHGNQLPCLEGLFRETNKVPFLIDFLNEDPGGTKVCEDYIAAQLEEALVEAITVPCLPGNVEFHFRPTIHGTHANTAFPASQ
ncbi:MAG: hypothetical protein A4E63_03166 [Syntrophorhabdus sp. PtaU1.Bin050]|nr:MAG: hypothetical protein A4E63_03166 [Syntrophorhabdus sp. PtaU1.Bin050]